MKIKTKVDLIYTLSQITDLFISSWLFMVGVGATHLDVSTNVPLISFWQSLIIVFTLWQIIPNGVYSGAYLRIAKALELENK